MKKLKSLLIVSAILLFSANAFAQSPKQGLRVGDIAPNFTLKNQNGKDVTLDSLLVKGPVVLTWYRGGWCPYCNVALKELSDKFGQIESLGATLVALSPELPDNSLNTTQKNDIKFNVLSDQGGKVAAAYDVLFKLDEQTHQRYEKAVGLSKFNGDDSGELPIPATYVIDQDGTIRYAYVNIDYRKRAPVDRILSELTDIQKEKNSDKLVVLLSSDDPMVAQRVALMYGSAAKRAGWFDEVTLLVWGPSAKMIAENQDIQKIVKAMKDSGVMVKACIACVNAYGVKDDLEAQGFEVIPMGVPLTNYLKQGYSVLTF